MHRTLCLGLSGLLALGGCTSTYQVGGDDMQKKLRPALRRHVVLQSSESWYARIDPNTELLILLRSGGAIGWIEASKLWASDLGLSYEVPSGSIFVPWTDIAGAQARNLSGFKTAGTIILVAAAVALIVAMIASKSGGGSGRGISTGRRSGPTFGALATPHFVHGRMLVRSSHRFHVRLIVPPPAPIVVVPPPPSPADGPEEVPINPGPSPAPPPLAPAPPPAAPTQVNVPASPLFDARARRRASIRLAVSAEGGAELHRSGRGTTCAFVGIRIHEALELAGGFRYVWDQTPSSETVQSYIGAGRLAAHLPLDAGKWLAAVLGLEAGGGMSTRFHLRTQYGLRFNPLENLTFGVYPFNASFAYYDPASALPGKKIWTFPSTLEVGFNY